jgi:hypothetical protein
MAKIVRIDEPDSLMSLFKVEIEPNKHQEIKVPIFLADLIETQIASMNFETEKSRSQTKTVLE